MIRIEPRTPVPFAFAIAAPVIAAVAALVLAAIMFALTGALAHGDYALMLTGVFGSLSALGATLTRAVPLILTGLAASLAFRLKLWNLGAAGQVQIGALAALAVGSGIVALPNFLMIPLVLVVGALAGALLMLAPALLKVRRGTDEAIVTLIINVMMMMIMPVLLDGPLIGTAGQPRTLIAAAMLPKLDWLIGVHVGALIALAAVIVIWAALPFTVWGFKLRATTGNADAARFAGIKVDRVMVSVGLISGALAGLAGAIELAGTLGQVTPGFGAGTGYAGIAVAVLAGRSFPGVVIAAVFIAALQTGADALPRDGTHVGDVLVALTLACAVIASMLVRLQVRRPQPDRVVP